MKNLKGNNVLLLIFILAFFSVNCERNKEKLILIDDTIVKGDIDDDSVFNGLMKFYTQTSGRLVEEAEYLGGDLHGTRKLYYPNGTIKYIATYHSGKHDGYATSFDSFGKKKFTNFYFNDLPVGPVFRYLKGELQNYYFYSFDGDLLFEINYDSIEGRKITDLADRFFFYHFRNIENIQPGGNLAGNQVEGFFYLPSPPKYQFSYELVVVDEKYRVTKVLTSMKGSSIWERHKIGSLSETLDKKLYNALKLTIYDSTNNLENTMFKMLPI